MSDLLPRTVYAGEREKGVPCAQCGLELQRGEKTAICQACGGVHHESCWEHQGGCGAYECSSGKTRATLRHPPSLTITNDDLSSAVPLPVARKTWDAEPAGDAPEIRKPWNRIALWSFVVSLLGIPLFGLLTGIVAMVLGCIALVLHTANRRGAGLAVIAIVLGLGDMLGWAAGLYYFLGNETHIAVSLDDFLVAPESLEGVPDHINRAMRANVLIQSNSGLFNSGAAIGSGVILKMNDGKALIATNRHVVDSEYTDYDDGSNEEEIGSTVLVKVLGQPETPGKVLWIAPHGVDLALVSAEVDSAEVQEAHWRHDTKLQIGDPVFAVGNPHGLGWSHTAGDISHLRHTTRGTFSYRVIQTSAAINPGNSGGGLYDAAGTLIGINTWTHDKRFAEGLGFSIAFNTLLDLIPEDFELGQNNPPGDATEKAAP
ncbi:MAG: trypsin-like peptidase domain-containing protein [Pirellulales bacterium]